MTKRLLFVNGSIRGGHGNSATLIDMARRFLPPEVTHNELVLASYGGNVEDVAEQLRASDAFVFVTGVYWSSWGSPLQRFLEVLSSYELSDCFLGKPAGVAVSMDSVGGMDVAQRLQGVLSLFGCSIPPLSSAVISRAALGRDKPGSEDVFQLDDLSVVVQNVLCAASLPVPSWSTWEITRIAPALGPYPHGGVLLVNGGLSRIEMDAVATDKSLL